MDKNLKRAIEFLKNVDDNPKEMFAIAKQLADTNLMHIARDLAEKITKENLIKGDEVRQKWALWHSKDEAQPVQDRHVESIKILQPILENQPSQESLGITGGIYKRMWEADGNVQHLYNSLDHYYRGYQKGINSDDGYTAVNTAFVYDLINWCKIPQKQVIDTKKIRNEILKFLLDQEKQNKGQNNWWWHSTIAETYFGLKQYDEVIKRIHEGLKSSPAPPSWMFDSTAKQLARLAEIQQDPNKILESDSWKCWAESFNIDNTSAFLALKGKVGFALSGGGFRASFFHIGVLAALAELDLLRHVEVLSGVSGGSILGAYYYLALRELLNSRDESATREEYISLVQEIAEEFLKVVKKNLRTRIPLWPWLNLAMAFWPGYSRTVRLADLFQHHFYSKFRESDDSENLHMNDIFIYPGGNKCNPKYDNWRRKNKVPILILNATSLNTGHNWQFTCAYMGEPPSVVRQAVDKSEILRRIYYNELDDVSVPLGHAVAASACVPGLFTPISLRGIYNNKVIRLVDGGVHDNQGTTGLLEQNCSILLISDASGQMPVEENPSAGITVPLRMNNIFMSRVRASQFGEIAEREKAGSLKKVIFLHLKKGLTEELSVIKRGESFAELSKYGLDPRIEEGLANMRTDLDSFSDIEAYALMTSGYTMARSELPDIFQKLDFQITEVDEKWTFLEIFNDLKKDRLSSKLLKIIKASSRSAFRAWCLIWPFKLLAILSGLIIIAAAIVYYFSVQSLLNMWNDYMAVFGAIGIWLPIVLIAIFILSMLFAIFRIKKPISQILLGILLMPLGWLAWLHLGIIDCILIRYGKRPRTPTTRRD